MRLMNGLGCLLVAAGLVVQVFGVGPAWAAPPEREPPGNVVLRPRNDPALEAAFQRARATLPDFFGKVANASPGMRAFAVKVGLDTPKGPEYVWLISPTRQDGQVSGILNNVPEYTSAYKEGQRLTVAEEEVVDWMYVEGGRMKGNFTACALGSAMPARERKRFEMQNGLECSGQ